ncbi:MAG: bifunctional pyr operon transcriptional regulator/uracil phosphoribosyltransferase PyrR [Bacteroidota bacterium]
MKEGRVILEPHPFRIAVERLAHQLIEQYDDFSATCIIGIQTSGVQLAERLIRRLQELTDTPQFQFGKLDITFYRDDFRTRKTPLKAAPTEMDFIVENKRVILVDDVLYSGRTVQAALTALNHYGRAAQVELVAMVDRRFNRSLPIKADYVGLRVDALDRAYVRVEWKETEGEDRILIFDSDR